jgi:hypothetical protein
MKKELEEARKHAKELEQIRAKNRATKKRVTRGVDNENLVQKVARKLLELYYRPKKKFKPSGSKTVKGLRTAGLTEKEIQRLK